MTLFAYLNGSDQASKIRLNGFQCTSRADGSVGIGGIVFDDSAAALTVRGWMTVEIRETACVDAPILFQGFIADRNYSDNSPDAVYLISSQRFVDCNIVDQNAVMHIRLITNPDGKRPAESHIERIDWLLGSSYLSGLVSDLGLVNRSNPRPMGAADYRGQYPDDVLNDVLAPIFRIFYVYVDPETGERGLFVDVPTAAFATSPLTISNVLSDLSSTCFAPNKGATLNRDPSEVYAKIRYTYSKGLVIENDATTEAAFFADNGLGFRGLQVDNSRIGSEDSARIMADSLLDRDSTENDTITLTVQVPAASAGLIQAGHRVGIKHTRFPGYESDFVYVRVTERTITQTQGTSEFYDLALTLSNHGLSSGGGGGAPGPGDFPHPPAGSPSIVDSNDNKQGVNDGNLHVAPSAGDNLIVWAISRTDTGPLAPPSGWTTAIDVHTTDNLFTPATSYGAVFSKVSDGSEGINPFLIPAGDSIVIWNFGPDVTIGYGSPVNDQHTSTLNCGTVTPTGPALVFGCAIESTDDSDTFTTVPDAGVTEVADFENNSGNMPWMWAGYKTVTAAGSTAVTAVVTCSNPIREFWGACSFYVQSTTAANPPTPTQDVPWTVVTMTTSGGVSVGTTAFPYADGSLQVKVDGVLISPAGYTETDPSCGDFSLTWLLDPDEVVTVKYIGR